MAKYDASDLPAPDLSGLRVMWLDITDPLTGETTTLDVADAPTARNGETITFSWDDRGFISMPEVEPPADPSA